MINIGDIALLCISQSPIFIRPPRFKRVADMAKTAFAHPFSDHMTLANALYAYMHVMKHHPGIVDNWCAEHGLNKPALGAVRSERLKLGKFLSDSKFKPSVASVTDVATVPKALAQAFCTHTAIHHSLDAYRTVHENAPGLLQGSSVLVAGNYEWIVYDKYFSPGKYYIQTTTAVNAAWLAVRLRA